MQAEFFDPLRDIGRVDVLTVSPESVTVDGERALVAAEKVSLETSPAGETTALQPS